MSIKTIAELSISAIAIIISVIALVKTSIDNNKILEATSRAHLSIYTESLIANKKYCYLVFRNFGKTNAFIKEFKVDQKTKEMLSTRGFERFDYLNNSNLGPGQSFTHTILTDYEEYEHEHISEFEITYTSGSKEYTEKFDFNLVNHTKMPNVGISNADYDKQFLELYQDEIRKKL